MTRWLVIGLVVAGCNGAKLSSDEEAELAYVGLDGAIERGLRLGLRGYSQADSANIPEQQEPGDVSGTMVVGGKVDQGASSNKELRLDVTLEEYADLADVDDDEDAEVEIVYDTESPAYMELSLRDMPDGSFSGTFTGTFWTTGDLEGEVSLDVTLEGTTEADPDVEGGVRRVEGDTSVTGTATNDNDGAYEIDLVL